MFVLPVIARVSSPFGSRWHDTDLHTGVDFAARYGAPVYAAKSGTVKHAAPTGRFNNYGNLITIVHDDASEAPMSLYAHLSKMLVTPGQRVRAGQKIGEVGNTRGTREDPNRKGATHLHFELLQRFPASPDVGRVDPTDYLMFATNPELTLSDFTAEASKVKSGVWIGLGFIGLVGLAMWLARRPA